MPESKTIPKSKSYSSVLPANFRSRLLNKAQAAAYFGISPNTFDEICADVRPIALADGRHRLLRYDVNDLDAWIARRKGLPEHSQESGDYWLEQIGNGRKTEKGH